MLESAVLIWVRSCWMLLRASSMAARPARRFWVCEVRRSEFWSELGPLGLLRASLVAEADGRVVGHVGLSLAWVDARPALVDVLVLSPRSVLPAHPGRGEPRLAGPVEVRPPVRRVRRPVQHPGVDEQVGGSLHALAGEAHLAGDRRPGELPPALPLPA